MMCAAMSGVAATTRADGPHGLVSDCQPSGRLNGPESRLELGSDDRLSLSCASLLQGLADAQDGREAGSQGRLYLAGYGIVRLAEVLASLGVADDDELAELGQHGRRDLSGEGPLVPEVHVLGA